MSDIEHILQRETVWHPNTEHRDNIVDLTRRQPRAFERIAVALAQVWSNLVVEFHGILTEIFSHAS